MKKILIFSVILVIVVVAGAMIYFNWRHNFIRREVPKLVFLKSDSLYNITYGDVYIDELNGEISIDNILLKPDTTFKTDVDDELPHTMLEVSIPRLHLTGLLTDQAMLNEQVIARKLKLSRPVVTLYRNHNQEKEKKEKSGSTTNDIYKIILRNLSRIKVDTIMIDSAQYNMVDWQSRDTALSGSPVNVALYNLDISDSTSTDTTRVLFAKKALVSVEKLTIHNDARLYSYRISTINLDSEKKLVTAEKIVIDPRHGESEFARILGKQGDRFDVSFSGARFSNTNIEQILDGNIIVEKLAIKEASIKIYRDKNYPRNTVSRVGRYPHQMLMRLPVEVSIGRMDISNGYIEYREKSDITGSTGKISFHHSAISATNMTNRPVDLRKNPATLVSLRSQFLNAIPVTVNFRLYPGNENGRFSASGNIGSADALIFNQLIKPLGRAQIESGRVISCSFNLEGNDYSSNGTVKLLYNDLKVKVLGKDMEDGQQKTKKFMSFLANATLKDENPKKNKPARIARVSYKRDPNKGFFNLVWKSIFTGVRETIGIETGDIAMIIKKDNR